MRPAPTARREAAEDLAALDRDVEVVDLEGGDLEGGDLEGGRLGCGSDRGSRLPL